jgi:hypothetical protein
MGVMQRIYNYLYECKCTFAIDLVSELVEYVKKVPSSYERHEDDLNDYLDTSMLAAIRRD